MSEKCHGITKNEIQCPGQARHPSNAKTKCQFCRELLEFNLHFHTVEIIALKKCDWLQGLREIIINYLKLGCLHPVACIRSGSGVSV
jgi:hypothetical protein